MTCRWNLAGIVVELKAPADVAQPINELFRGFPPAGSESPVSVRIAWEGNLCHAECNSIALLDVEATGTITRFATTLIVLQRSLARAIPGLVIVHGNALVDRHGQPTLLVGRSGSGKTTLTRLLLAMHAGELESLAEDLLLLEPATRKLHAYPRAFLLRPPDGAGLPSETPRTPSGKLIVANPGCRLTEATPTHATVVILRTDAGDAALPSNEVHRPSIHVSAWSEVLASDLDQAGFSPIDVRTHEGQTMLQFDHQLEEPARAELLALLETRGSLVLHANWSGIPSDSSDPTRRPEAPVKEWLEPEAGVMELLHHTVRFAPHAGARSGGELFMALASCFSEARFLAFTPGGSAPDSARELQQLISVE